MDLKKLSQMLAEAGNRGLAQSQPSSLLGGGARDPKGLIEMLMEMQRQSELEKMAPDDLTKYLPRR